MTEETQLFKYTIANNIRIGKLNAADEKVIAACKKASIHYSPFMPLDEPISDLDSLNEAEILHVWSVNNQN